MIVAAENKYLELSMSYDALHVQLLDEKKIDSCVLRQIYFTFQIIRGIRLARHCCIHMTNCYKRLKS